MAPPSTPLPLNVMLMMVGNQDTAKTDEERNKAFETLKAAKEAQKDDPVAGQV